MLCKKPFIRGIIPYGCGQCMPCRINRGRLWQHRILLESLLHGDSTFLTLTYDDENLPTSIDNSTGMLDFTLDPEDLTKFWKKLRSKIYPRKVRYYSVGEYGDESGRPHYHASVFGVSHHEQEVFESCWTKGFVYAGDVTFESAAYVARYVTKKMTSFDDCRLRGRYPEFARQSNRPGIGAEAIPKLADALTSEFGHLAMTDDVPGTISYGMKSFPLGRYLKNKLRDAMYEEDTKKQRKKREEYWKKKHAQEMRGVLEEARKNKKIKGKEIRDIYLGIDQGRRDSLEVKYNIYRSRGKL